MDTNQTQHDINEGVKAQELEGLRNFVRKVAGMTQRTITDNTTDEAESNGVAKKLRGFISEARLLEQKS